jgi:hypothetical protein
VVLRWSSVLLQLLPGLLWSTLLVSRVRVLLVLLRVVVVTGRGPLLLLVRGRAGALLQLLLLLLLRVLLVVVLRVVVLLQLATGACWAMLLLLVVGVAPVAVGLLVAGTSLMVVLGVAMTIALMHSIKKQNGSNQQSRNHTGVS